MKTILQTPVRDIDESINYYKTLGFTPIAEKLFSDGKIIMELNPERTARAGVKLYKNSWIEEAEKLKEKYPVFKNKEGYIATSPSGTWVYLIESENINDYDISKIEKSILGNNMGLSLETVSMEMSILFWEILGFKLGQGCASDSWAVLNSEDGLGICILGPECCPHLFYNPSLTFFNGKNNINVINKIKELNIPITEEVTVFNPNGPMENVIIRDPGGFGMFIFND